MAMPVARPRPRQPSTRTALRMSRSQRATRCNVVRVMYSKFCSAIMRSKSTLASDSIRKLSPAASNFSSR